MARNRFERSSNTKRVFAFEIKNQFLYLRERRRRPSGFNFNRLIVLGATRFSPCLDKT